ncbi:MAG: IF-2 protein, partial [Myxococcaceae bacterium]
ALFAVIEGLARPRVTSDDPKALEAGLYYLRRAERLSGLTEEQKLSVKSMQAEVAYYQARSKLEDAQRLIGESLTQLKLAAAAQNRNAHSASKMILAVEPPAKALETALRTAVHGLSAPPDATPPVMPIAVPEERQPEAVPAPALVPAPAP